MLMQLRSEDLFYFISLDPFAFFSLFLFFLSLPLFTLMVS